MIEQVDRRLREWIQRVLDVPVPSLSPPSDARTGRGVSLYLLELADRPPPRGGGRRPSLQLSLRYLVTTWADDPEEAHRLLGELVFAAMEQAEFEVELDPVPAATWAAFGVKPQPSFVLCVPLRRERLEPPAKLVREPVVIRETLMTTLRGIVLGPDDAPLARAVVEIPSLQLSTRTDLKGQFTLSNVPAEPRTKSLRVRAKGRELDIAVEQPASEDQVVVIHFNLFE